MLIGSVIVGVFWRLPTLSSTIIEENDDITVHGEGRGVLIALFQFPVGKWRCYIDSKSAYMIPL